MFKERTENSGGIDELAGVIEDAFTCGMEETISYTIKALQAMAVDVAAVRELAGAVCIALCILSFFIQKNIRKRICIISGCIFFYLSLNCNILDYVWHGFHYPNQLPGRWSFCLIFLIVKQAYVCCGALAKLCRERTCRGRC